MEKPLGFTRRKRSLKFALLALAVISAIVLGSQLAAADPSTSKSIPTTPSATCGKRANVKILFYMSQVAPNTVSPLPNGCWAWSSIRGVDAIGYHVCSVNPWFTWTVYGSASNPQKVYDDTNSSHTSPDENSLIKNGWNGSPCLNGSTTLNVEYQAASGCSANWVKRIPSGVTVQLYQAETYCSDPGRDVSSLVSAYTASSTSGGVVNAGADVPSPSGPCTASCQSHMTTDINGVCNRTQTGQTMTLYADYPVSSTVQSQINTDLNNCIF